MGIRGVWFVILVAGCGASSPATTAVSVPAIEFTQETNSWNARPVRNDLTSVSNNGLGYTGDIDVYEMKTPVAGRLQVSLIWDHVADFDLIVAADPQGEIRLAEGLLTGNAPEYVGLDVAGGQTIYLFVAGWEGDPGEYTLETTLVPPDVPLFELEATTDFEQPVPANEPIRFFFNQPLDPVQDVSPTLVFIATAHQAEGSWCIQGNEFVFYPRIPEAPGDLGGLYVGEVYTLQFQAAARGLQALNGEFLSELFTMTVEIGPLVDRDPNEPPRVTDIDFPAVEPWDGRPITITLLGLLDPWRVEMNLFDLGTGAALPLTFTLKQQYTCTGSLLARLTIEPVAPLPPGAIVRLAIPGTVLGITGEDTAANRVEGGLGYQIDLATK